MRRRNLEKSIKNEAKNFVPNVIDNVYETLGIQHSELSKADMKLAKKVNKESKKFVPNVKKEIYASIGQKPQPAFFKPLTIGLTSTAIVSAIALAVILPIALNRSVQIDDQGENDTTEVVTPTTSVLNSKSAVNMRVVSASETYQPAVIYSVGTDGRFDISSVISLNDASSNIISNLDTDFSSRTVQQFDVLSFTSKYLSTALNLGYIERQDVSKYNQISIEFNFDKNDETYFNNVINSLNEEIKNFLYENKVVASVSYLQNKDDVEGDSEIVSLIRIMYELTTKLFVTADGKTVEVLCFSLDFNDWVEKYKDSSTEELQKHIDFLKSVEEMISDDEMKELFMERLVDCSKFQDAIDDIPSKYDYYFGLYKAAVEFFNNKFHEHMPVEYGELDPGFDWWDDFGHDHPIDHPHHGGRRGRPDDMERMSPEDYYNFVEIIKDEDYSYEETIGKGPMMDVINRLDNILYILREFYHEFNRVINESFGMLIDSLENGEFFDDDRPPHEDHFMPPEDGWEDEFDDWWNNHYPF